jgi:hypothetical protein
MGFLGPNKGALLTAIRQLRGALPVCNNLEQLKKALGDFLELLEKAFV